MDFRDKVVVVTGAGSGMGRAYAEELARREAVLALNDYDADGLAATVAGLGEGVRVLTEAYDVSDRDATYAFAERVRRELGDASVVINNAGVEGGVKPAWATDDATYARVMSINFDGVRHGTRAFLPQLLRQRRSAVVNVSSLFGLVGTPNNTDYCASKFAVRGYTEALATELLHSSVRVHLVHPGGIATGINRAEGSQAFNEKYLSTPPEQIVAKVLDAVGSRRIRIVYGNDSFKTWLGARFLPLAVMTRLTWRDMKPVIDASDYPARDHV